MIKEDYVSFEVAKLLKEKGFEQDCDYATSWYAAEYYKNSAQGEWFEGEHQIIEDIDDKIAISYLSDEGVFIPAPTHQMALKWLRENNFHIILDIEVDYDEDERGMKWYHKSAWYWIVYRIDDREQMSDNGDLYSTYEEAVEAALLYVLKNLI